MELLKGSGQNQPESAGSSSTLSGGLRFGQKIYFEDGSGAGLSKNRVNAGRKSMTARCQVEGCRMDLSNAKTYYSRHKVCCVHSKSSKVIVSGLHQRFCQQCSRFHQLSEFDLEKRSCRRRLACHNERRRKPQATTTLLTSRFASIAPSLYGNAIRGVLGDPATWSTTARGSAPWQSHQLMNVFSYGNSSTDSSCALSLLSNSNLAQQEQQRLQTPTNTWRPSLDFDSVVADRVTMAQPPPVSIQNQYLNQTWEFMSGEKSNEHCISPALGLNQISEPVGFQISNGTTMGGFELSLHQQVLRQYLEPENTRAYDSSPQQFNWSL
ncbi:Squamosa promoter-binding-like protein 15 [Raphanus sativus]|uniref:Squamosa promoter-binding protein-like 15 n=1 Tax=Raphanus sativus TaxID=3726 RepID=A0A6J0KFA1_RAPSA|nr:squamosa promoter-binding protein-like 15 [Raphanus sativus]KAJ4885075.1 Squamosa promoter-binding-like protein 15 [Raphanus sativus]